MSIKPKNRPKADFAHIETLDGMSEQDRADFAWNNLRKFFRVTLYDQNKTCAGCKKTIETFGEATLDHIVPRSRGGRTRLLNLQIMHNRCNSRKSNKLPKYIDTRAFIPVKSYTGTVTNYMKKSMAR